MTRTATEELAPGAPPALASGENITAVWRGFSANNKSNWTHFITVTTDTHPFWFTAGPRDDTFYYNDEGSTWIRGWHAPETDQSRALVAAFLLLNPMANPRWP